MSPSEFAFLALGLILGTVTGAAFVVVARSRPFPHEIRLTVAHDAVPRRGSTLATDAFAEVTAGPAAGGPGDRRRTDRSDAEDGTAVPFNPIIEPALARRSRSAGAGRIPIRPERDSLLARLAAGDVGNAAHAAADEPRPRSAEDPAPDRVPEPAQPAHAALVWRLLDGNETALPELLDTLGPADADVRGRWEVLLTSFVARAAERAVDLGLIDVPMGNPFWDTFTIDQCRLIATALASMGHRYDGAESWVEGLVPGYRDLSQAVADIGLEPRRIRAWPNQSEIASLFEGARPATLEAVEKWAPGLVRDDVRSFLANADAELDDLWAVWDDVLAGRPATLPAAASDGQGAEGSESPAVGVPAP